MKTKCNSWNLGKQCALRAGHTGQHKAAYKHGQVYWPDRSCQHCHEPIAKVLAVFGEEYHHVVGHHVVRACATGGTVATLANKITPIADRYAQCSFDMRGDGERRRRGGRAMSDCCRRPAISGVYDDQGNLFWRCLDHEGELTPGVFGDVTFELLVGQ